MIGKVKVDDKSKEIMVIAYLLEIVGVIIIDVIGTQEDIINKVVDKGTHRFLSVRDN